MYCKTLETLTICCKCVSRAIRATDEELGFHYEDDGVKLLRCSSLTKIEIVCDAISKETVDFLLMYCKTAHHFQLTLVD